MFRFGISLAQPGSENPEFHPCSYIDQSEAKRAAFEWIDPLKDELRKPS